VQPPGNAAPEPAVPAAETALPGLIWLDEGDAERRIAARAAAGELSAEEAANLRKFAADGYLILRLGLSAADAAAVDRDVDALWQSRPADVAFAYDSPPRRFSEAVAARDRRPRYRIHELQWASDVAMRLYLEPTLHRYASLILGEKAIATQSLYFEYGSQQALHRDSVVVPTPEFGRLVAAWIALEDIAEESGPLMYVPGSHRLPFYEFGPRQYLYDASRHSGADVDAAMAFYRAQLDEAGLSVEHFCARRGEVLIWHSALSHGGSPPSVPERTRKSFVVHFSALSSHPTRYSAVSEVVDGVGGETVFSTSETVERGGALGFTNPLRGEMLYRR
jgi:phytanoyl-CoA hydroxylase